MGSGFAAESTVHVTFLLSQSLDSPSGRGRFFPLAREMVRLGHACSLVALHHDWQSRPVRSFEREGVRIRYAGPMHVRKVAGRKHHYGAARLLAVALRATLGLVREALRVSPADVVHVCKPHPMNALAGLAARWARGRPLYLDCDDYEAASNRFSGEWQRSVVANFEDRLPRMVRGITTNTRYSAGRIGRLGVPAGRIVYVPNGVDRGLYERGEGRNGGFCLAGPPLVAYLGSLSLASHPVDLLVRAFALVRRREPSAVLRLIGDGEDRATLVRLAERLGLGGAVEFTGYLDQAEAQHQLSRAWVSVDPVADDPAARARSPLKLMESLALGVPVVTSRVGDRAELLLDGGAGELVAPGDEASLAEGLLNLLQSPTRRAELAAAGRERVRDFFWDRLALDFLKVYELT